MKNNYVLIYMLAGIISLSCSRNDHVSEAEKFLSEMKEEQTTTIVSEEIIGDVIQQIPSPMEMSMIIRSTGLSYDDSFLSQADDYKNYNTPYRQALNLGIYGTDLIYTNIFEMNQDGMGYIKSIKSLANELNIGQFFNMQLITELAVNSGNIDSLLLITVRNFNDINKHLQSQKRANLSVLLLVGGWLEGVHINCAMARNHPGNEVLEEKIGEQKIFLESILLLVNFYAGSDPYINDLKDDILALQQLFGEVKVTYTYEEPTYEIVDGVLSIVDHSSSQIEITREDIEKIATLVEEIRMNIIS